MLLPSSLVDGIRTASGLTSLWHNKLQINLTPITADPGNALCRYCPMLDLNVCLTVSQKPCTGYRISEKELERVRIRFLACVKNACIIRDSISGLSCNLQAFMPDLFNDVQGAV
jgi:hypothetical protein